MNDGSIRFSLLHDSVHGFQVFWKPPSMAGIDLELFLKNRPTFGSIVSGFEVKRKWAEHGKDFHSLGIMTT